MSTTPRMPNSGTAKPKRADHASGFVRLERRLLLRQGLSLGALTLLTGCNLSDGDAVDRVLWAMSRWNDRVQAALFVTNDHPGGYWEDQGYNWFSGS